MKFRATNVINKFKCLQADCPDTCCKGWSMQVDDETFRKYVGAGLDDAVSYDGQTKEIRVMKRDPETDYCVKFTDGICSIHRDKGPEYLGDACHLYPRITLRFGNEVIMTSTLSCPEIVNLAMFEQKENLDDMVIDRIPQDLRQYEGDLSVHQFFLDLCNSENSAEQIISTIYSAAKSLSTIDRNEWITAAPFFLKIAGNMLPEPEYIEDADNRVLQIFAAVFHATGKKMNPRLAETLGYIENYLGVSIDWGTLELSSRETESVMPIQHAYNDQLKKYIAAQISFGTFPYAGIGNDIVQKVQLMIYKFTLIKLALKSLPDDDKDKIIQAVQSISRIIDHISEPTLILKLMETFGWNTDAKIIGLING